MKVMKAATFKEGMDLRFPVLVSTKLDGIRCILFKGNVLSAQLKPIPNKHVQKLFGKLELHGLDGELIVGPPCGEGVFKRTTSGLMSVEGEPEVRLYTFDMWSLPHAMPFVDRLKAAASPGRRMHKHITPLPHVLCRSMKELLTMEEQALSQGFEGLMIRDPAGPYKEGRSTEKEGYLFKLKRFVDDEAEILGVVELQHNENEAKVDERGLTKRSTKQEGKVPAGTMGALQVKCPKFGATFEIGTGFSQEERDWFWQNRAKVKGMQVKFKYFPVGVVDAPRHPTYLGIRAAID